MNVKFRNFTWKIIREINLLIDSFFFWKVFDFTEIPFEWESYTNFIISLVEISWNQYPFDQLVKKVDQITVMLWHHTVWKFRKFFPTAKIFRQIDLQYYSLHIVKKLIWRNFCKISWGKNLQISTLCIRNFCITLELFREIAFMVTLFTIEVVFTEIFQYSAVSVF